MVILLHTHFRVDLTIQSVEEATLTFPKEYTLDHTLQNFGPLCSSVLKAPLLITEAYSTSTGNDQNSLANPISSF